MGSENKYALKAIEIKPKYYLWRAKKIVGKNDNNNFCFGK